MADRGTSDGRLIREVYFPTILLYKDIEGSRAFNEAVKPAIHAWRLQDEEGIVRSNVKRVSSWHSVLDLHHRPELQPLVSEILATATAAFSSLGYDPAFEPAIDNMWAIVSPKYGFNRSHTHPGVLWSGVYYVQAPEGSGRIYFSDPRQQALVLTPRFAPDSPRQPESWSEVYFEPIEGRMLLFPAWLVHEVEPNMSTVDGPPGDRISLSFNLFQRRRDVTLPSGRP
jgi:uncharacterized protein (TIGR02466 family)